MIVIYDGTFPGWLTTVFEAYERKLSAITICTHQSYQPTAFDDVLTVVTDEKKALRVWEGLNKKLSIASVHNIYAVFLSELPSIENVLLAFVRHVFNSSVNVEKDFGHNETLEITKIARTVFREKHRMEAFVRFQRMSDNVYTAVIEPKFNVLPLIITHFRERYADQNWLIYDIKRSYGVRYLSSDYSIEEVFFEDGLDIKFSENVLHLDELHYQELWKNYFSHVNIPSRKNMKLHIRHVPVRYWKHLTEKNPKH